MAVDEYCTFALQVPYLHLLFAVDNGGSTDIVGVYVAR